MSAYIYGNNNVVNMNNLFFNQSQNLPTTNNSMTIFNNNQQVNYGYNPSNNNVAYTPSTNNNNMIIQMFMSMLNIMQQMFSGLSGNQPPVRPPYPMPMPMPVPYPVPFPVPMPMPFPVPVEKQWKNPEGVESNSWGDPHFRIQADGKNQNCFDFQGRNNTVYNMVSNSDFELNSKFNDVEGQKARVIKDQNLTLKGSGVNIVTHSGGKFEIYYNGEKIGDQTNYKNLVNDERLAGISLNLENSKLKVSYNDREITQQLNGGNIDNYYSVEQGDRGIMAQLIGSVDNDGNRMDGITQAKIDINKDGKVDEDDVLNYDTRNQVLVNSNIVAISAPVIINNNDDSEKMAKEFMSLGNNAGNVAKVFDGAFEDSGKITNGNDERLKVKDTDSKAVKNAKLAMKALLLQDNKSLDVVADWIESSSKSIERDSLTHRGSMANRFEENNGYSRSQWNELIGSLAFTRNDKFLKS